MSLFYFLFLFFNILELVSCDVKHHIKTLHNENTFFLFLLKIFIKCTEYRFSLFIWQASGLLTGVPSLTALKYSPYEVFVRHAILKMESYRPKQAAP
jgi:hypothetical protein